MELNLTISFFGIFIVLKLADLPLSFHHVIDKYSPFMPKIRKQLHFLFIFHFMSVNGIFWWCVMICGFMWHHSHLEHTWNPLVIPYHIIFNPFIHVIVPLEIPCAIILIFVERDPQVILSCRYHIPSQIVVPCIV